MVADRHWVHNLGRKHGASLLPHRLFRVFIFHFCCRCFHSCFRHCGSRCRRCCLHFCFRHCGIQWDQKRLSGPRSGKGCLYIRRREYSVLKSEGTTIRLMPYRYKILCVRRGNTLPAPLLWEKRAGQGWEKFSQTAVREDHNRIAKGDRRSVRFPPRVAEFGVVGPNAKRSITAA